MKPIETLKRFDLFLEARQLELDAVVIGGSALALLGVTTRQTRDCDVLHPALSEHIRVAARRFAREQTEVGNYLADDWLNNGPDSLARELPAGWLQRTHVVYDGRALRLSSLHRLDLLRSKLFALCDRGIDHPDCVALAPTAAELQEICPWLEQRDGNPDWPAHVRATLGELEKDLADGV